MLVFCPICHTNQVQVQTWRFTDTAASVPACDECKERTGAISLIVKVSALIGMEVPTAEAIRHQDGLTDLGGSR